MGLIRGNQNGGQLGRNEDLLPSDETPAFVEGKIESEEEEVVIPGEGEITTEEKPATTTTTEKPTEEKPAFTFKTQAELDAFIESKIKSTTTTAPGGEGEEIEEEDPFKDITIFKGYKDPKTGEWIGEKPDDWNDFARKILHHLSPKEYAPRVLKVIQGMTAKERKEMETINSGFDAEMDEMAAQGLIPSRTTDEGKKVDAQISALGGKYGLTTMKEAYNLWKQIPVANGGGLDFKPGTPAAPVKPKNPNKEVARLIGSSGKTTTAKPGAKSMSYAKLHSARSVDELLEED